MSVVMIISPEFVRMFVFYIFFLMFFFFLPAITRNLGMSCFLLWCFTYFISFICSVVFTRILFSTYLSQNVQQVAIHVSFPLAHSSTRFKAEGKTRGRLQLMCVWLKNVSGKCEYFLPSHLSFFVCSPSRTFLLLFLPSHLSYFCFSPSRTFFPFFFSLPLTTFLHLHRLYISLLHNPHYLSSSTVPPYIFPPTRVPSLFLFPPLPLSHFLFLPLYIFLPSFLPLPHAHKFPPHEPPSLDFPMLPDTASHSSLLPSLHTLALHFVSQCLLSRLPKSRFFARQGEKNPGRTGLQT